ncbi:MAG: NFACT family protein [Vampirovibrionales bacterium]
MRWQALDPLTLQLLAQGLQTQLVGSKVQKLQQHAHHDWVLQVWKPQPEIPAKQQYSRLVISVNRQTPYVYLARPCDMEASVLGETFQHATPFCMALRKFLQGAVVLRVETTPADNALHVVFNQANELGFRKQVTLTLELMGKYSNLILHETETAQILAISTVVSPTMSSERQLTVGGLYQPPPTPQHKPLLIHSSTNQWRALLQTALPTQWVKQLQSAFWGCPKALLQHSLQALKDRLSTPPETSSEASSEALLEAWLTATEVFRTPQPNLDAWQLHTSVSSSLLKESFHWRPHTKAALTTEEASTHALQQLEAWRCWVQAQVRYQRFEQQQQSWLLALHRQEALLEEQTQHAEATLVNEVDIEQPQAQGDALLTLYSMKTLPNNGPTQAHYTFENPLTLQPETFGPFDVRDSWLQAGQRCYKQVHKLKGKQQRQLEQWQALEAHLATLKALRVCVETAQTLDDLAHCRDELETLNVIKRSAPVVTPSHAKAKRLQHQRKVKHTVALHEAQTPSGLTVWIGKNNAANAQLITKLGKPTDWWFHVGEGLAGSHVVVRTHNTPEEARPSNETIAFAGGLAAWFSSGRESGKVPVMMTQLKHVTPIPKSWPGHVTHKHEELFMLIPQGLRPHTEAHSGEQ